MEKRNDKTCANKPEIVVKWFRHFSWNIHLLDNFTFLIMYLKISFMQNLKNQQENKILKESFFLSWQEPFWKFAVFSTSFSYITTFCICLGNVRLSRNTHYTFRQKQPCKDEMGTLMTKDCHFWLHVIYYIEGDQGLTACFTVSIILKGI